MAVVHHVYQGKPKSAGDDSARKAKLEADAEFVKAKTAQAAERAKLTRLEYARRRGQLIERELAVNQVTYLVIATRQHLLLLPARLARSVTGMTDEHKVRMKIDEAIREALNELADAANRVRQPSPRE
jgi:hypothetical protein